MKIICKTMSANWFSSSTPQIPWTHWHKIPSGYSPQMKIPGAATNSKVTETSKHLYHVSCQSEHSNSIMNVKCECENGGLHWRCPPRGTGARAPSTSNNKSFGPFRRCTKSIAANSIWFTIFSIDLKTSEIGNNERRSITLRKH